MAQPPSRTKATKSSSTKRNRGPGSTHRLEHVTNFDSSPSSSWREGESVWLSSSFADVASREASNCLDTMEAEYHPKTRSSDIWSEPLATPGLISSGNLLEGRRTPFQSSRRQQEHDLALLVNSLVPQLVELRAGLASVGSTMTALQAEVQSLRDELRAFRSGSDAIAPVSSSVPGTNQAAEPEQPCATALPSSPRAHTEQFITVAVSFNFQAPRMIDMTMRYLEKLGIDGNVRFVRDEPGAKHTKLVHVVSLATERVLDGINRKTLEDHITRTFGDIASYPFVHKVLISLGAEYGKDMALLALRFGSSTLAPLPRLYQYDIPVFELWHSSDVIHPMRANRLASSRLIQHLSGT
mgnify:FL=1